MTQKILIVDDEPDLLGMFDLHLIRAGYATLKAASGGEALRRAVEEQPDLVLLDIMLPDLAGTEVCRMLQQDPRTAHIPVIFLTARGEQGDRIRGLELGADDYVVKTVSMRELVLRVQAVLRRRGERVRGPERLSFGMLELDVPAHRVYVNGEEVSLTALEFRLLRTLLTRRGRVQSRDTLLEDVWGITAEVTTRTVDTHVKRLREKIGDAERYLETVRGVGYRFKEEPD